MAELIVDALEAVDIDQQKGRRGGVPPQPFDGVAQAALHVATIEDAGQRVHDRLIEEPACRSTMMLRRCLAKMMVSVSVAKNRMVECKVDVVIHQRADDQKQQNAA